MTDNNESLTDKTRNQQITKLLGEDKVPLDEQAKWILGQPCFTVASIAQSLIIGGFYTGKKRAEDEQAIALHFMLRMYLNHGDEWRTHAATIIKSIDLNYKQKN